MITAPRRHKHCSSSANRPSDIAVIVNIDAEFNMMAVNPIIAYFSRNPIPKYCHNFESSVVFTTPNIFVKSLPGRSNESLPLLPLHTHAEEIIPTFLTLNIYIRLCLPKALTLTRLQSYEIFEVLFIIRINYSVGLQGILYFPLLRDAFLFRLAEGIPFKKGVL